MNQQLEILCNENEEQHDWVYQDSDHRTEWHEDTYTCSVCNKTLTESYTHDFSNGHQVSIFEGSEIE